MLMKRDAVDGAPLVSPLPRSTTAEESESEVDRPDCCSRGLSARKRDRGREEERKMRHKRNELAS